MHGRRSLSAVIGRHFAPWRKSRRTTLAALVFGLLLGRRLGLAAIARRMAGAVTVRHKIKRVGRFADNKGRPGPGSDPLPCRVGAVPYRQGAGGGPGLDVPAKGPGDADGGRRLGRTGRPPGVARDGPTCLHQETQEPQ